MNIARIVLAVIVVLMAGYSIIMREFWLLPYTLIAVGVLQVVNGMVEMKLGRKGFGVISFATAGFVIVVAIVILILA
ncbi:hypothetical protein ACFFJI_05095 [Allobacillus sp. GCM10007491]|uniref:DUF3953 domain-containing protein n=2 Tax=Allobacillus TaxID=1400133 RepID=A0A941HTS1_9BACI|nr:MULTISPECIES: hypothetical protein [Allobacillus]MBR7554125.1 hypothetical protein [Allobacillus saliphilus]TSJ65688.1 hypothetical protein FPQ13_06450 [Allobacillus salarius]